MTQHIILTISVHISVWNMAVRWTWDTRKIYSISIVINSIQPTVWLAFLTWIETSASSFIISIWLIGKYQAVPEFPYSWRYFPEACNIHFSVYFVHVTAVTSTILFQLKSTVLGYIDTSRITPYVFITCFAQVWLHTHANIILGSCGRGEYSFGFLFFLKIIESTLMHTMLLVRTSAHRMQHPYADDA